MLQTTIAFFKTDETDRETLDDTELTPEPVRKTFVPGSGAKMTEKEDRQKSETDKAEEEDDLDAEFERY